jgi:hypothetical protein
LPEEARLQSFQVWDGKDQPAIRLQQLMRVFQVCDWMIEVFKNIPHDDDIE